MYKQSPSRSHRSKGIKVKHILQICLLLAVCFWLIYQVKHSHAKRKEFDTKDEKVGVKVHGDSEIQRLGRKVLPRATELATDVEKHEEDDEEKEVEVEEEDDDEIKHEEDEPEKEDNKHEEEVNGGRGDGDDEIDENDTERNDVEAEHEEEPIDEDKENEENQGGSEENRTENGENDDIFKEEDHSENEENEGAGKVEHTELEESGDVRREDHNNDAASEDQDNDGVNTNTHEAREEQYKADDASSEVAHEIQTIIPETGNLTTGQAGEIWGKVSFGQGNETQTPEKEAALIHLVQRRQDVNLSVTSAAETGTEQKKHDIDSTKPDDSPLQNSTLPSHQNTSGEQSTSLLSNGTQMGLPSSFSQNATGEGAKHGEEHTELVEVSSNKTENADSNPQNGSTSGKEHTSKSALAEMSSIRTENVNSNVGETLNRGNAALDLSQETNRSNSMEAAEDSSLKPNEKSGDNGTSVLDENSETRASDEGAGSIRGSLGQEGGSKTDSGSLPEIRSDTQSTDAKVAV